MYKITHNELIEKLSSLKAISPELSSTIATFQKHIAQLSAQFIDRTNYTPGHITTSCLVLTPDFEHVLLIYHTTLKRWLQPGGHIEINDHTLTASAKRELLEETGLGNEAKCVGLVDLDIHTIPKNKKLPEHNHYDMRFLFIADKKEVFAGSDASDAKWVSVANLSPDNADESLLRALKSSHKLL